MKVVEILKIGQNLLELLQKSRIKVDDVRFIGLYDEYLELIRQGNKKSYAVLVLSQKYNISERQVYYIIKKLSADCKIRAVG